MKFYYNNQLIRTSKNHEYTHATINTETGRCLGCRTSEQACESIISSEIREYEGRIEHLYYRIKMLKEGKKFYYVTYRRCSWKEYFKEDDSVENYLNRIEEIKEYIEHVKKNWKVVELEMR